MAELFVVLLNIDRFLKGLSAVLGFFLSLW
jgi:hypothetical protein